MTVVRPPSGLAGVTYGTIARHADSRGSFRELWRDSQHPDRRFVQANLSESEAGVLRGLHLHRRQDDLWIVVDGRAFAALVDLRPSLGDGGDGGRPGTEPTGAEPTGAQPTGAQAARPEAAGAEAAGPEARAVRRPLVRRPVVETRTLEPDDWVVIPRGVAHGFLALEPLRLAYLVSAEYDGTDELGFAWDDPAVGVPWPVDRPGPDGQPILSERDAANPPLADLLVRLRSTAG